MHKIWREIILFKIDKKLDKKVNFIPILIHVSSSYLFALTELELHCIRHNIPKKNSQRIIDTK